ncbi:MAG TPA: hypothetical protein PLM24_02450 [Methanothrix sp.]|nr:hypothetical protein [Methanothrix sp.]HPJ84989.1 hypothetical protein [Methanothrix sp.]HPR65980.1 hypothetical protein [Methanothrix sp.]
MRGIGQFILAILLMVVGDLSGAGLNLAGRKTCDVSKAMGKLYKNSTKNIARILYDGRSGLAFGDLQAETGLTRNKLNHELISMRNLDLVKLVDGRYYLTWYGALLLENVDICERALAGVDEDKLFEPFNSESGD